MHREILTKNQIQLLPVLKNFSKDYILTGGTAIALHLGHRRSIDFDLFTSKKVERKSIKNYLVGKKYPIEQLLYEEEDQIHFIVHGIKITFFWYPFRIEDIVDFDGIIRIPDLLSLAAMKAFALGGRGKWKDYVDLYFLTKHGFSLRMIIEKAEALFGETFNGKLFKEQLSYFEDIDYEEEVIYLAKPIPREEIEQFLIKTATEAF
jgi:hypothetical protein